MIAFQALYESAWIASAFNWSEWQLTASEFIESPKLVDHADATTIMKLFTTHVRADRFCEGHLAAMFENGHIVALLRRLKQLHSQMSQRKP